MPRSVLRIQIEERKSKAVPALKKLTLLLGEANHKRKFNIRAGPWGSGGQMAVPTLLGIDQGSGGSPSHPNFSSNEAASKGSQWPEVG